jgi:hypothetical protein
MSCRRQKLINEAIFHPVMKGISEVSFHLSIQFHKKDLFVKHRKATEGSEGSVYMKILSMLQ